MWRRAFRVFVWSQVLLLFGLVAWAADFDRMERQARQMYGGEAAARVVAWRESVATARGLEELEQLRRVNDFFNRQVRFADDIDIWGVPDYWATPLETLGRGEGDCEDFTIAKYMTLRELGISNDRLRLIYVRAAIGGTASGISQAHMVLGYYPSPTADPLILDNLIDEIRPGSRRPDLTPVFSFNSDGLWVGGATSSSADPTARLSRWRDVLERMRREGLR